MSVFIVNDQTFVKVFNTLFLNEHYMVRMISDSYKYSQNGLKEEILKLHKANYESYNERYNEPIEYKPLEIDDRDYSRFDNLCQLLKALRCINYQIELNEKQFDPSFLNRAIKIISSAIIEDLPEYEAAAWG